jgi:FkbM family methyltransferase
MMKGAKNVLREFIRRTGFRVTRDRPANRFDALCDALSLLRGQGYRPRVIIDGGANFGTWTEMVRPLFPDAEFHLIEPQPACAPALKKLSAAGQGVTFHPVAVTRPGVTQVQMVSDAKSAGGTGAYVIESAGTREDILQCPATTLDNLFADRLQASNRTLLKLDVEGHEISALEGAERLLAAVEVILSEVQFFQVEKNGLPVFSDLLTFLRARGFELFDFASLSPRPRDMRLRQGDVLFVRRDSPLLVDCSWA